MCLLIKKETYRTKATEDIVCYKVVKLKQTYFNNYYVTYYFDCVVELGKTYTSYLRREKLHYHYIVHKGLHTFKNLDDAKEFVKTRLKTSIIKCIIPKGSWFFEGNFDVFLPSYASSKLKYIEIV